MEKLVGVVLIFHADVLFILFIYSDLSILCSTILCSTILYRDGLAIR